MYTVSRVSCRCKLVRLVPVYLFAKGLHMCGTGVRKVRARNIVE